MAVKGEMLNLYLKIAVENNLTLLSIVLRELYLHVDCILKQADNNF